MLILLFFCSPAPKANLGAGPSNPVHEASASTLPPVAIAFEKASANQEAEASQAASDPVGHEDASVHDDTVFGNEDAWFPWMSIDGR